MEVNNDIFLDRANGLVYLANKIIPNICLGSSI